MNPWTHPTSSLVSLSRLDNALDHDLHKRQLAAPACPLPTPGVLRLQYSPRQRVRAVFLQSPDLRKRIGGEPDEIAPTRFDRLHRRTTLSFYTPPDPLLKTKEDFYGTTGAFRKYRII